MAVDLVKYSIVDKATANAYADMADADAYFNTDVRFTIWDSFDDDTKKRALITAARNIDSAEIAAGKFDPVTPQALRFPLAGMLEAIPITVLSANIEEAIDVLTNPQRDFINAAKHGGIGSFSQPGQSMNLHGGTRKICYRAKDLLARYISTSARMV